MIIRWRARTFGLAVLAVAAVAAFVLVRHVWWERGRADASVQVGSVERRDIAVTIEATGTIEPIDLVEVKSKASGQILRMPVEVGTVVHEGDLLAQIDTVDVSNQYEQTRAAQDAARAKLEISRAQKARSDQLFAEQVITADEHEAAVLDLANAESQSVKAATDLDVARQKKMDTTVRAPIAGTVLAQLVSVGQVISSATSSVSGGTSLLEMADLSRIRLRALVTETDIGRVKQGQSASVSVEAFPDRPFEGVVEKIEPQAVVQQSVTMFPVLVSISNEQGLLLPGMNGEVTMLVEQRSNVTAVPLDAVRPVRELPLVAAALGLNPQTVQSQLMSAGRARRGSAGADSTGGRRGMWAGRGARRDSLSRGAESLHRRDGSWTPGSSGQAGTSFGSGNGGTFAGAGATAGGLPTGTQAPQVAFAVTDHGLEPRLVRIGISDFDYAQVLTGLEDGEQVALLSAAELQAKRVENQSRIRERMGNGIPGSQGGGGGRSAGGRR